MDNLLNLVLEAHHPIRNHHRRYEFMVGRDLFGEWTLTIRYGRIGTAGQCLRFSSSDPRELQQIIRSRLQRRSTAHHRIGCPYHLTACSSSPKLDRTAWLPQR